MKKCKHCQSEIDEKAKVCPKCQKKQGISKGIKIFLIILGVIVLVSAFGGGSDSEESKKEQIGNTTEKQETKEKFTLLEGYNGYPGDYSIGYYIEGYIQNNTNKEYSYVSVEFNLYDADGALIGTALDNVNNLEGNGKWKFKATSLISSDQTQQVASYKLKEITGW